jgi:hypothetical protein
MRVPISIIQVEAGRPIAKNAHEVSIGEGLGGGHVDDAVRFVGDLGVTEQQIGDEAVIEVVQPGDILMAGAFRATEAEACETG